MSALTNQTSVNGTRSFFEAYGQSSSVPQNINCSTLTAVVSVTAPTVNASALNNVTSINGNPFAHPGVGDQVDTGLNLDSSSGYNGNNRFFDITNTNSSNVLALDPPALGTVGGNWVQISQEPGNAPYTVIADNTAGVGLTYVPVEVIQGTDTTSRLYIYNGGQGINGTGWQKVAGTYTMELVNLGGFSNILNSGAQTFTMPNTYSSAGNLQYRVHAQGRIQLDSGTPTSNDNCSIRIGMNVNTPPAVCGTVVPMGLNQVVTYDWNISGTIFDPVVPLPINSIYTQTNLGSNGNYTLYVDSFTVAQV